MSRILSGGKPEVVNDLVQIDAARPTVSDGAAWLRGLQAALDSGDFSGL